VERAGFEGDARRSAAPLLRELRTGVVHQDPSHDLSRHREELTAALPGIRTHLRQPDISFVDQRRRLERTRVRLARQVRPGDAL